MPNPSREDFISLSRIARICSLFLILVCSAAKPAVSDDLRKIALIVGNSGYQNVDTLRYPYPVKAGYPTVAGRRRTRAAPHGMAPALSWA
jgi:hypothetical protein